MLSRLKFWKKTANKSHYPDPSNGRSKKHTPVNFDAQRLAIPIYLNQRAVFDLLAIFEDGFARLKNIKTSVSESESRKGNFGASIGVSNAFALLGTSFSAERGKEIGSLGKEEISQEKVHTPTSLFAKCRTNLSNAGLLREKISDESFNEISTGDFVEFKATLRKNPVQESLGGLKVILELVAPIGQIGKSSKPGGQQQPLAQVNQKELVKVFDAILDMVAERDVIEIIGDAVGFRAVIPCQSDFFSRGDPTELVDGEFYVLGKVIQIARKESASINLLRKSKLGKVNPQLLDTLLTTISSLADKGFETGKLETEIPGPAILVHPIAIYI